MSADPVDQVSFTLNGAPVVINGASPRLTLHEWLYSQPGLTGTKRMCAEGGCGCCVLTVERSDPVTGNQTPIALNSCLCPLYSVNGWEITTVERLGNSSDGYHPIQHKISDYNATQCGYCTPGMVMSMYSLLQANPKPTKQEIEDSFDGNICRCTGYRPILDAMKSFAVDSSSVSVDIEDLSAKCCKRKCAQCPAYPRVDGDPVWYSPTSLSAVMEILATHDSVKLITGDTGRGVFKIPETASVLVDLKNVTELKIVELHDSYLKFGATIPLNNLIGLLLSNQDKSPNSFGHLAAHLKKIANVPVRNIGSWAGNLMLTHDNANFPSDVFTIMSAVNASVTIASSSGTVECSLWEFLKLDMTHSVIISMQIPFLSENTIFRSYKIMPRAQNAHAYVNAAFCMSVDLSTHQVVSIANIVYGGIEEHAIHVPATESYLTKKSLSDVATLQGALAVLSNELNPNQPPVAASTQYRKSLAINLFYKFYLTMLGDSVSDRVRSAAVPFVRPVSQSMQSYDSDKSQYPITQPMSKLTSLQQASGEAQYTTDIPVLPGELTAALALTNMGNAKITAIHTDAAMTVQGAVKVLTADDIPGTNNFMATFDGTMAEPILADGVSIYAGQAVALVLADTQANALKMAAAVTVSYEPIDKPLLTVQEAIAKKSFHGSTGTVAVMKIGDTDAAINSSDHVITGEIGCGAQYHFTMETQTSLVVPEDDGYTVHSSTQWPGLTQGAVSAALGVPVSSVDVIVKRVGGGYGSKISRGAQIAAACALGSHSTRRPVRMHMDIDTNMKMVGKRYPYYATYKVGCTKDGILNAIEMSLYEDGGCTNNDSALFLALANIDNAYKCPNWLVTPYSCKTDTCSNTACRSPGTMNAIFIMESLMDHVARSLDLDVEQVKDNNLYKQGDTCDIMNYPKTFTLDHCNIRDMWTQLYSNADVTDRKQQVVDYNKANRWKKRGISVVPLKFAIGWANMGTVLVDVYASDGSVAVSHAGVEIGQGINTKVAQVAAKTLGVPLNTVRVKPTNTIVNPNGNATGGSITSELNCSGVLKACQALKERLDKVKQQMSGDPSWLDVVKKSFDEGVDLSEKYYIAVPGSDQVYNVYGATCTEVELDILTGEIQILRVDILHDCGQSINPEIDLGQVEGAFVMGLGEWLTERVVYDTNTGELLTHNTWEYKPPSSKDIPIDFRVSLLKNAPNPLGILGSKAVGEPPLVMSSSALFAAKRAIESARAETGNNDFFTLPAPATVEMTQLACLVDQSQFTL